MKTRKIGTTGVAALILTLGVAGCTASPKETVRVSPTAAVATAPTPPVTAAPTPPVSGTVSEGLVSTTATVKALDLQTRRVTLQRADGSLVKFRADESIRNLPQVKVGDEVMVTYYESLAYEVKKPGEAAPGAVVAEELQRAKLGAKPGAVGTQVVTITATIAAIDKTAMTVTLRGPDGDTTTIKARDPQKLDRVAVGDLVEISYTEAVAISVETPTKK